MPGPAVTGAKPAFAPTSNTCDFIFSNPVHASGATVANAETAEQKSHHIPKIPLDRPIFLDPVSGAKLSWQRLKEDSLRIGAGLQALNLQTNPPHATQPNPSGTPAVISPIVLIHLPNCLQFPPILYGVFAAGLTATMANTALTAHEVAWILQSARPALIVTSKTAVATVQQAIKEMEDAQVKYHIQKNTRILIVDPESDDYGREGRVTYSKPSSGQDWKILLSSTPMNAPVAFTESEGRSRTAVILWSSGTTGKSKGVVLSHAALDSSVMAVWHLNPQFGAEERWLGFAPFYHVFGLAHIVLMAPGCGATVLVMPKFEPEKMLKYVQDYRVTNLHVAPPVGVVLAKSPLVDGFDLTSVKGCLSGGAPLGTEVIRMVYDRLRILIKMGYGTSEGACIASQLASTWGELEFNLGSVGPPNYGVEIKIVDVEDKSRTLNNNEEGEILTRSPSVMNCYLNNEKATNETLDSDGWCYSGDVGKIDDNGDLWITDRLKEMIKVKGFQVSPADLEAILCASPIVADAGVTALFDKKQQTELPRAYVVPKDERLKRLLETGQISPSPDILQFSREVKEFVEAKTVHYKWLRGGLVLIAAIPKSPSGKILRRLLKDTNGVEIDIYGHQKNSAASKL